jgi:alpha-L-fucosidase 2
MKECGNLMTSTNTSDKTEHLQDTLDCLHVPYPARGVVSQMPANRWDFGTVVGNGSQGALAFCRPHNEELVLSHEELFLPLYPLHGYLPVKEHFETIRDLVINGKTDQAQRLIARLKIDNGFPVYNTTNPFVGACALDLLMDQPALCNRYIRAIDFATGEAIVAWQDEDGLFHRQFFVSRTDEALVIRLSSPQHDRFNVTLGLREIAYDPPTDPRDHNIYAKTIERCECAATPTHLTYQMRFKHRWDSQPVLGCCTVARIVQRGGHAEVTGSRTRITDAGELLLFVRTVPHRNGQTLDVDAVASALDAIHAEYAALLASHAAVHGEMFHRCRLRLATEGRARLSGEEMQRGSHVGNTDPRLVETAFDASRYGIIASTGKLPPALQGVWTGTWKPRWSWDYTLNGNVQSMVAASLCGNHFECQESLMDYLDTLMDDFRENSRQLLGFRGPLIPWRSSTHGKTHYLAYKQHHHNFPGIYWMAGAAWFAQIYYDYYLHTGNETFFEKRLKPFLLDAAAFYEDFLTIEQDGTYVLAPDSSPENEIGDDIWMAPNPTMTIAGIKQLLRTVVRHAGQLGVTPERVETWQTMLAKLPAYAIGGNGALKEWTWPGIENNEKHRHASHLYPLYYGVDPEIEASPALREACRIAIENRIAPRRADNGGFMAFGFTQFGLAAAHLGDTMHAYECVEYLVNAYWSPIMVSQHNHEPYGPDVLNLDISGGLPAVIIAMLVQSQLPDDSGAPWRIRLLPCLPPAWPAGSLTGVRCRGGLVVDITWQKGTLDTVVITSLRGGCVTLELENRTLTLKLPENGSRTLHKDAWRP